MLIDNFLTVSDKQAVTATAASTDVIDFDQANPNTGMSGGLSMVVSVDTTATSAGASTVAFQVQDCDTSNGTYVTIASSGAIGKADLVKGAQFIIPMPLEHRQFVRLNYTVGTADLTAGKFNATVTNSIQLNKPTKGEMGA